MKHCSGCDMKTKCKLAGECKVFGGRYQPEQSADAFWITSSHSGGDNGSQCVEVGFFRVSPITFIRDSKNRRGGILRLPKENFVELLKTFA